MKTSTKAALIRQLLAYPPEQRTLTTAKALGLGPSVGWPGPRHAAYPAVFDPATDRYIRLVDDEVLRVAE